MFSGDARVSITTDLSADEFDEQLYHALERLGDVTVERGGEIDIRPKTSLVSFFSTVTLSGRVKAVDGGYKVTVDYSVSPSTACWIAGVVLFLCIFMIGGAVIFVPVLEKSNVTRAVENALQDLKESTSQNPRKLPRKRGD